MENALPWRRFTAASFSKTVRIVAGIIIFLGLVISVIAIRQSQDIRGKAKENDRKTTTEKPKPEYAPGEVLVKFKPKTVAFKVKNSSRADLERAEVLMEDLEASSLPPSIVEISRLNSIKGIEKVNWFHIFSSLSFQL
jgi:hypothetical protein